MRSVFYSFIFILSLFVTVALSPSTALADDDFVIVDIRRNIPLADDEPAYKDFYIDAGSNASSLKKNLVVTAVRTVAIRDSKGSKTVGDLHIPVAQLRILTVDGRIAVAREYKPLSRDDNPMLEQVGIQTGDRIDIKGAFTDTKPLSPPKPKVVEATPVAPTVPAVVAAIVSPAPAVAAPVVAAAPPVPTVPATTGPAPASVAPPTPVPAPTPEKTAPATTPAAPEIAPQ